MAQGKLKTKVKLPEGLKKKTPRAKKQTSAKRNIRQSRNKPKDLLQKEVEKEIRKKIEQDARSCLNS